MTLVLPTRISPSRLGNRSFLTMLVLLLVCVIGTSFPFNLGLKWGDKCRIPGPNEYLKPSEECEMSKGLHCQQYQQGNLCGCLIRSSLSYDEHSGECRRKPGHHCMFMNTTESPGAYDSLGYHHKCHTRAECVIIDPIPEIQATQSSSKKTSSSSKKSYKTEQFAVCKCRPGYKQSRDGLVCQGVNGANTSRLPVLITSAVIMFALASSSCPSLLLSS